MGAQAPVRNMRLERGDRIEAQDGRTGIVEGFSRRLERCIVSFDGEDCARLVEPGEMVHALIRVRPKEATP